MRVQSLMQELGTPAPRFAVPDPAGHVYTLRDFDASPGLLVAFLCNHCPFVLHILDAFVKMASEYQPKGIATVAISSNDVDAHPEDGPAQMAEGNDGLAVPTGDAGDTTVLRDTWARDVFVGRKRG